MSAKGSPESAHEEPPGGGRVPVTTAAGERGASPRPYRRTRERCWPGVSEEEWNDWRWQMRHRLTTRDDLERVVALTETERAALDGAGQALPSAVTPYYASLMDPEDPEDPIRRTVVPRREERVVLPDEAVDPLGEEEQSPVPGLVHRYPDRVLFLATGQCATYCRYCTRSRVVGAAGELVPSPDRWEPALRYIASHPEVRDVIVSGGDPLTLGDSRLELLLERLRAIPHVEIIRIGTKVPMVLPQRITPDLAAMLRRYHPLFVNVHVTHPAEFTPEARQALARLADAGIPLGSQTVLLAGVNDDVATMRRLVHELLRARVRPYYLYQCDPVVGTGHFRTPVARGLEIVAGLRGHTSGLGVPTFVVDAPGGGGKIALYPEAVVAREAGRILLRNYQGRVYAYPDPGAE